MKTKEKEYDNQKARKLLETLGLQPYLRGYQVTLLALECIAEDPQRIQAIRKEIYPAVAKRLKCSESIVDGAIRRACDRAWKTDQNRMKALCAAVGQEKLQSRDFLWALYCACCR